MMFNLVLPIIFGVLHRARLCTENCKTALNEPRWVPQVSINCDGV